MKIQIASDIHLETAEDQSPYPLVERFKPVVSRDLLVLAGDIGVGNMAERFVERELKVSPVIYVPGNHEYYSEVSRQMIDEEWGYFSGINAGFHYLVAENVQIDGVNFFGAPWYSDFWNEHNPVNLLKFNMAIGDFFHQTKNRTGIWDAFEHQRTHLKQTKIMLSFAGKIDVVITHWPPTKEAIHPFYDGDPMNPYFINDREDVVRQMGAKLWISGHTHESYDYRVGETRCVGNPSGFPSEPNDNPLFRPDLVVEV